MAVTLLATVTTGALISAIVILSSFMAKIQKAGPITSNSWLRLRLQQLRSETLLLSFKGKTVEVGQTIFVQNMSIVQLYSYPSHQKLIVQEVCQEPLLEMVRQGSVKLTRYKLPFVGYTISCQAPQYSILPMRVILSRRVLPSNIARQIWLSTTDQTYRVLCWRKTERMDPWKLNSQIWGRIYIIMRACYYSKVQWMPQILVAIVYNQLIPSWKSLHVALERLKLQNVAVVPPVVSRAAFHRVEAVWLGTTLEGSGVMLQKEVLLRLQRKAWFQAKGLNEKRLVVLGHNPRKYSPPKQTTLRSLPKFRHYCTIFVKSELKLVVTLRSILRVILSRLLQIALAKWSTMLPVSMKLVRMNSRLLKSSETEELQYTS